jgi:hypothetical protein
VEPCLARQAGPGGPPKPDDGLVVYQMVFLIRSDHVASSCEPAISPLPCAK